MTEGEGAESTEKLNDQVAPGCANGVLTTEELN
jgi:hypothetical protein